MVEAGPRVSSRDPRPAIESTLVTGRSWADVLDDQTKLAAGGYVGLRHLSGGRALLLIDLYNRAFGSAPLDYEEAVAEEPSSCGRAAWDSLPHIERVLAMARRNDLHVVHTVADSSRQGIVATQRSVQSDDPVAGEGGDWGNRIVEPLAPTADELVISKPRASAFFGTALEAHLRAHDVRLLLIVGESTSGCVRATVVDAYSLGFHPVVIEEGVFDRSPTSHSVSLFDMNLKYATVLSIDDALEVLETSGDVVISLTR